MRARGRRPVSVVAAITLGVAGATLAVTSGSPLWGAVRAAVVLLVAMGVAWTQGLGARVAGWSALCAGLLTLPVAGVIAGDALVRGSSLRGVAAAVTALGAATLLAAATIGLIRASRGWRRWLALPVALVLVQFVVVPLAMGALATNRAPAPLGDRTPGDVGLVVEEVVLEGDGVQLAGWYVPSDNGVGVLLLHGSGSTRSSVLTHAQVLAGLGYGVLMVDARGHGESTGTAMDLGWWGDADIAPAVDYLLSRHDVTVDRVAVVGLSMGGEQALTAAATDERIVAVVAEGVGVRVAGDVPPGRDDGWLPRAVNAWGTTVTDFLTSASPPAPLDEAVAAIGPPRRALIIAGLGEGAEARWLAESSPGTVAVWEVPDAGHTAALRTHPEEWRRRVAELLASAFGA